MPLTSRSTVISAVSIAALAAASGSVSAQEAQVIDQVVDATCSSFLAPVLGRKEIAMLVAERSIDSRTVCSCAKAAVRADQRLSDYIALDNSAFNQRVEEPRIRSYIVGRVLQSVLACFSLDLSSTLAASTAIK